MPRKNQTPKEVVEPRNISVNKVNYFNVTPFYEDGKLIGYNYQTSQFHPFIQSVTKMSNEYLFNQLTKRYNDDAN